MKYLHRAAAVQKKLAVSMSIGISMVYLIMFGFYGYAFYWGGLLRWSPDKWVLNDFTGERYSGGEVIGIMFCIMMGMF